MPAEPSGTRELTKQVYEQLRLIARVRLREQVPGHTLQATALVHEAYLKLRGNAAARGAERAHFYRIAAEAMRQILIDHARAGQAKKRGGGRRGMGDVAQLAEDSDFEEIVALDEAVSRLTKEQPRAGAVVHLRFYAGLSVEETADALGFSVRTVNREWDFARAWLFRALE